MISSQKKAKLELFAMEIRMATLRQFHTLGFGHVGGSMSIADVLAALYGDIMRIDPANPNWDRRDYLVLSKGHAGPALYATLALKGYFPESELDTLNKPNTTLPSHCDRNKTPGIDMSAGSLGQGLSCAAGIAMGNKMAKKDNRTYCIVGDGECDEGQIWEAALFAPQFKLDNLILYVDYNKQQLDGYTKDVIDLGDLRQKFDDFGWYAQECDGHDVAEIIETTDRAKNAQGKPCAIILHTKKGKGATFAEDVFANHHMEVARETVKGAIDHLAGLAEQLKKEVAQ